MQYVINDQFEAAFPFVDDVFHVSLLVFLVSMPFSVITSLVYACIKELRNLHGKCLMCYVFSLIVLHTNLLLILLDVYSLGYKCILAGFLLYLAALVNNFWLNVMSFDIWQTLKSVNEVSPKTCLVTLSLLLGI